MVNLEERHLFLQPLDRDAPNGRAKWVLTIGATDGLHHAHTTLHVNVKDINDNAPFFPDEVMEGRVAENGPAGQSFNVSVTYTVDTRVVPPTTSPFAD